jgi:branched-chain amino acid transport system substrate-binding protein
MRFVRAAVFAAAALAVAACQSKKPEAAAPATPSPSAPGGGDRILVGHVGSMTGSEATFGQSTDNGIRLAAEQWNARGGVKGKPIEVKTYDSQGKPEEAAVAATRLLVNDRVNVLLGEVASSRSLAMAPAADDRQVPMITPSSTNPRVTKEGGKVRPFVFRVCFIDPFQGTVMAKFARDHLKVTKVAILRDVGNDYSVGLADFFQDKFRQLGGEVVTDQSYKAGDQDFKAQLTAIKNRNPEAIYVPGYYTDVALIARQSRELGMKQPLLGGDGWDSQKLYEIGGKAIEGSFYSNHYSPDDPSPRIQEFVAAYQKRHGSVPDGLAAQGYDAAMVAFDAMSRATAPSGPALRDAIAATKGYPGVTGVITIDENHDALKPAVVLEVKGGKSVFVTSVAP